MRVLKLTGSLSPAPAIRFFGFSRSFYYELDKRLAKHGKKLLIHIRGRDKKRGVTLIPYAVVEAIVRAQMETQEDKDNPEVENDRENSNRK